jgi:hypothetical protein
MSTFYHQFTAGADTLHHDDTTVHNKNGLFTSRTMLNAAASCCCSQRNRLCRLKAHQTHLSRPQVFPKLSPACIQSTTKMTFSHAVHCPLVATQQSARLPKGSHACCRRAPLIVACASGRGPLGSIPIAPAQAQQPGVVSNRSTAPASQQHAIQSEHQHYRSRPSQKRTPPKCRHHSPAQAQNVSAPLPRDWAACSQQNHAGSCTAGARNTSAQGESACSSGPGGSSCSVCRHVHGRWNEPHIRRQRPYTKKAQRTQQEAS